jgi:hypothetical protein
MEARPDPVELHAVGDEVQGDDGIIQLKLS